MNLQPDQPDQPYKKIALSAFAGGVGGMGAFLNDRYIQESPQSYPPSTLLPVYIFLGVIAGIMGNILLSGKVSKIIKQLPSIELILAISLLTGYFHNNLLTALEKISRYPFQLNRLEQTQTSQELDFVTALEQIAIAPSPTAAKTIALKEFASIAVESNNPEVVGSAIAATDSTAEVSNPELKQQAIQNLYLIAQNTEDEELISNILLELEDYASGRFNQKVTQEAITAIANINKGVE